MRKMFKLISVVILGGLPFACAGSRAAVISSEEAHRLVASGARLVDVRTPDEYAAGHIAGAVNIPVDELSSRFGELLKDKPIITYCRSGARSARAARLLAENGFTVRDLGSMSRWRGE